jgi:hypothetical protein
MLLKISKLELKGIISLVIDMQRKGITLVFKNDPLQSVLVSSSFDNVHSVRDLLQREIETQLRKLFQDDLPSIIHNVSKEMMGGTKEGPSLYNSADYLLNLNPRRRHHSVVEIPKMNSIMDSSATDITLRTTRAMSLTTFDKKDGESFDFEAIPIVTQHLSMEDITKNKGRFRLNTIKTQSTFALSKTRSEGVVTTSSVPSTPLSAPEDRRRVSDSKKENRWDHVLRSQHLLANNRLSRITDVTSSDDEWEDAHEHFENRKSRMIQSFTPEVQPEQVLDEPPALFIDTQKARDYHLFSAALENAFESDKTSSMYSTDDINTKYEPFGDYTSSDSDESFIEHKNVTNKWSILPSAVPTTPMVNVPLRNLSIAHFQNLYKRNHTLSVYVQSVHHVVHRANLKPQRMIRKWLSLNSVARNPEDMLYASLGNLNQRTPIVLRKSSSTKNL